MPTTTNNAQIPISVDELDLDWIEDFLKSVNEKKIQLGPKKSVKQFAWKMSHEGVVYENGATVPSK